MRILLLDNYDSFTYNLVHLVEQFDGVEVSVHRNNEFTVEDAHGFDKIILSPGPGLPDEAGILKPLIVEMAGKKSILGVCLGMQAIAEVFGASLFNLDKVQHGIASETTVIDDEELLFKNIPRKFNAGRYHSWVVSKEKLPDCFRITSVDSNDNIMSLRHSKFDICGVQFHPESVLSEYGREMMGNWLGGSRKEEVRVKSQDKN
ncbi:aminodeoxychorismate/anthranilate synthase component II [soil metagenome]